MDGPLNHAFTPENFEVPYCFNVSIEDDYALENTEAFHLNVVSEDTGVDFKISSVTVEIQDNDSEKFGIASIGERLCKINFKIVYYRVQYLE